MCVSTHALRKGRPTVCLVVTGDLRALCSLERVGRGSQPTKTHTHCVRLKLPQPPTPPSPKLLLSQQVCVFVCPRPPACSPVLRYPLARENAGVRFLPSLGSFLFLCRSVSLALPSNGGQQDSASHVCCQRHLLSLGEDYSSLTNSSLFSLLPLR